MLFAKKSSLLSLMLVSALSLYTGCTKDEEAMESPMEPSAMGEVASPPQEGAEFSPVYFAFDSSVIKKEFHDQLVQMASRLKETKATVQIEGHCDERGTVDYNIALGNRRAHSVKNFLVQMGVSADNLSTISYGEERPAVDGHSEEAWRMNRRAEFVRR